MPNTLANLVVSVSQDTLSLMGLPGSTLAMPIKQFFKRQMSSARDELLEAMKNAEIDELQAANEDELVSVIYKYFISARDGVARKNLRLMASCLCSIQKHSTLYADDFHEYAETLSRMTRDQILVAATSARAAQKVGEKASQNAENNAGNSNEQPSEENVEWQLIHDNCSKLRFTEGELHGIYAELAGIGLLRPMSGWGMIVYITLPKLRRLYKLAELEKHAS